MEPWDGWSLGRTILAFSALLFAGIWVQLSLMHWAAGFRRWEMLPPVFVTPVLVLCALLGVLMRDGIVGWVAVAALAIGSIEGLVGVFFHIRGTLYQIGGLTLRNLMAGPPPVLPLAYSLTGVLGLLGMLWDA